MHELYLLSRTQQVGGVKTGCDPWLIFSCNHTGSLRVADSKHSSPGIGVLSRNVPCKASFREVDRSM